MLRSFSLLTLVLFLAGCASTPDHLPASANAPLIIAHRGASAVAPENTLAAFEEAVKQGADYYELDCRITKDQEVIVLHDSSLEKTTGVQARVWDMNLPELKQLDAGSWFSKDFAGELLPTLDESLAMAKNRIGVYVEIKSCNDDGALHEAMLGIARDYTERNAEMDAALMAAIKASGTRNLPLTRKSIAAIRAHGMEEQAVIQSFSPVICAVALIEAPDIRTEFLGSEDEDDPAHWDRFVAFGNLIGVHGFNVHQESLTAARVQDFQRTGKTVAAWTVDDKNDMLRLEAWGVNGIITNKPAYCREVLTP
jgi:glycerophosphoryl diester phosphodiesterase